MTGAASERPWHFPHAPGAGREPMTTTAPSGTTSGPLGRRAELLLVHEIEENARRGQDHAGREHGAPPHADALVDARRRRRRRPRPRGRRARRRPARGRRPPARRPRGARAVPTCAQEPTSAWLSIIEPSSTYAPTFTYAGGMTTTPFARNAPRRRAVPPGHDAHALRKRPRAAAACRGRGRGAAPAPDRLLDAEPERREDALLHRGVRHPDPVRIRRGGPHLAALERVEEREDVLARHAATASTGRPASSRSPAAASASSSGP